MSDLTLEYVSDERERPSDRDNKGVVEHVQEVIQGLLDALAELLAPLPPLVPVRVRQPNGR